MLDKHGFDLWAEGYDKSVNITDEKDDYPFAWRGTRKGESYVFI